MTPRKPTTLILSLVLLFFGMATLIMTGRPVAAIPLFFGASLLYLGWWKGCPNAIVFGHAFIILVCFLITWGVYVLPDSHPIPSHIFGRPLFWGLFSLMGGICSNYHGFCQCVGAQKQSP
jgi:hypothetical protein